MILDSYPTRLYWVGYRGLARLNGRSVRLIAPPHLPGLQIEAIDYVPGPGGVATVMPKFGGWRDMFEHEIAAADELLRQITKE